MDKDSLAIAEELKKRIHIDYNEDGYGSFSEPFSAVEREVNSNFKDLPKDQAGEWSEAQQKCKLIAEKIKSLAEKILSDAKKSGTQTDQIPPKYFDQRAKEFETENKESLKVTYPSQSSAGLFKQ